MSENPTVINYWLPWATLIMVTLSLFVKFASASLSGHYYSSLLWGVMTAFALVSMVFIRRKNGLGFFVSFLILLILMMIKLFYPFNT